MSRAEIVRAAACRGFEAAQEAFGDEGLIEHFPMTLGADVNAPPVGDVSRSGGMLRGIFFDPRSKPLIPNGYDPRTDQRPGAVSGSPRFEIFGFESHVTVGVKKPDLLKRPDGSMWRVSSVFRKPRGVVVAYVNAL